MPDQPAEWIALNSPQLSAAVNPLGAQLSVLRDGGGRDLLWNGDPAVWAGRAPILFPTIGELAGGGFRVGPRSYQLPRHGFARTKPFEVIAVTATEAAFSLAADESTRRVYPFEFRLDVRFALAGATLSVTSSVLNTGREVMPASIGYHPGFRWPLPYGQPRAAHFIEFATDENPWIRRLNAQGLLSAERPQTPVANRRLVLDDALFRDDVVIFDDIRSRSVTYGAHEGPRIQVSYPDATYLGVWTKPGAGFVCIEPWHGIADAAGFAGEFKDKLGAFSVPPGGVQQLSMQITLLD